MAASPRLFLCFSVPFFLIGVLGLGWGAHDVIRGLRSKQWPHTDGVITSAKMVTQTGGPDQRDTYGAGVSYDFTVDSKYFSATRIAFGDYSSGNTDHAQTMLKRYPPGTKVVIYYSPANPENAVLETGVHPGVWIAIGVGGIMLVCGVMILAIHRAGSRVA